MKRRLFLVYAGTALVAFGAAAMTGYSPFGDGKQERDAYSRGGGPSHK
ncbi:hypothetical protein K3165_05655 [Qipengyuania sp. 1XM1-15A]|nr:hypothetical protein [Qipengyuania xiamenensis]MBX7532408.1 hypothetical protein [Qipengyuania xiamenensis]